MTALKGYDRLEAVGTWRERAQARAVDVVASLGDSTIVIMDMQSRALTHWAIPAVERANPGELPAIYHPDGDPEETLELAGDEIMMIEAIEKLRSAIAQARPKTGRLRLGLVTGIAAVIGVAAAIWLPDALRTHAATVVPMSKRVEIGRALSQSITELTGAECRDSLGSPALARFARRLFPDTPRRRLIVVPGGARKALHLPGGAIVLNRSLIETFDDPSVAAGYAVAEEMRANMTDPMVAMLDHTNVLAVAQLLTTGEMPERALDRYAKRLMRSEARPLDVEALTIAFAEAGVPVTPYAYALDPSGEHVREMIAADPYASELPPPLASDGDWISIQSICQGQSPR